MADINFDPINSKLADVRSGLDDLATAIASNTDNMAKLIQALGNKEQTATDEVTELVAAIDKAKSSLNSLTATTAITQLITELTTAATNVTKFKDALSAAMEKQKEAQAASIAATAGFLKMDARAVLGQATAQVADAQESYTKAIKTANTIISEANRTFQDTTKAVNQFKKDLMGTPFDFLIRKAFGEFGFAAKIILDNFGKIFSEVFKIANAGVQSAANLGISATEGAGLEFSNRLRSFTSIFTFDPNRMVTPEQMNAAASAAASTFAGLRAGTQLSSEGMVGFVQDLKTGFKSEFVPTQESLRALATVGATTTEEFTAFREASGRASLSSGQFAQIVNKNSLSFLLFGNSFAKAAADAERLGISLASVQKGQESYVTNLDGAIDTIAQLNQVGATVDFGTLTRLAEFGSPDQVISYIKSNIPSGMFGSASLRALVGQLFPGIDAETLLRLDKTGSALDELEGRVTETSTGTSAVNGVFTGLSRIVNITSLTFGGLITAVGTTAFSLLILSRAANSAALAQLTSGTPMAGLVANLSKFGAGLGGGLIGTGLGTAVGTSMGASPGASLVGSIIGAIAGSFVGNPFLGAMIGGTLGGAAVGGFSMMTKDDATFESGYGTRVVFDTESKGVTAVSNSDKLVAIKAGATPTTASDTNPAVGKLLAKHDELLNVLSRNVPITINGQMQMVPATKVLSGVEFRYDATVV